jgi:hypothetical protein
MTALGLAFGAGFGVPAVLPTDAQGHETWPWWAVLGEAAAVLFFLWAVGLMFGERLRAVWAHSPYQLRSPLIRRNPATPKVKAPLPELGRVDLQILMSNASEAAAGLLDKCRVKWTATPGTSRSKRFGLRRLSALPLNDRSRCFPGAPASSSATLGTSRNLRRNTGSRFTRWSSTRSGSSSSPQRTKI